MGVGNFVPNKANICEQGDSGNQIKPEVEAQEVVLDGKGGEDNLNAKEDETDQGEHVKYVVLLLLMHKYYLDYNGARKLTDVIPNQSKYSNDSHESSDRPMV